MLTKLNSEWTEGTHIKFWKEPKDPKRKTDTYFVGNKGSGEVLGAITWFSRWRKYSFYPYADMTFEETCLREIAEFIEQETRLHREAKKKEKANAHTVNT
jgi:hypothetical protein